MSAHNADNPRFVLPGRIGNREIGDSHPLFCRHRADDGRCNVGSVYVCRDGPVFTLDQLKHMLTADM